MWTPEQIAKARLDDFRVFLAQGWSFLKLPRPTPIQLDIAQHLQHGPRRMIIQAFRGVGKSWITAMFTLWNLFRDPQVKVMAVSASQDRADWFAKFCKDLIFEMELLQWLRPKGGQRVSNIAFDVGPALPDQSPSVRSAGLTGQMTGSRADLIVPDDIEVPKNSYTVTLRDRIKELVKEFDAILKPGGRVAYLGTPQVEETVYRTLQDRGYTRFVWTAEVPKRPQIYTGDLAPFIQKMLDQGIPAGTPTEPERFDQMDLAERRASYGEAGYALQFMLDTTLQDIERHPLKLRNLIVTECGREMAPVKQEWGRKYPIRDLQAGGFDGDWYHAPVFETEERAQYSGTAMFIDPSGQGMDETAYAVVRFCQGQLYLVDCWGYRDGYGEETLEALARAAAEYEVSIITTEPNYGGGMFGSLFLPVLRKHSKASFDPEDREVNTWSVGQKEMRILNVMEPLTSQHRLTVDRTVIEKDLRQQETESKYSLVYQYTRLTRDKHSIPHEDRLEAVAGACNYWVEYMRQDKERALESFKDKAMEKELRRFMRSVGKMPWGSSASGYRTWHRARN